jgi:hypothetical protein
MYKLLFVALISAAAALAQQAAAEGARLEGHVRDRDGKPVRKAGLTLRRMDSGSLPAPIYAATSDAAGVYSFSGINPGSYSLSVERSGYLRGMFRANPHETFSRVALAAGQQIRDVDVTLKRGGSVSGLVLDEDGDPVAGLQVRVLRLRNGNGVDLTEERSAGTDDSGRYQIPYLEPGPIYLSAGPDDGTLFSIQGMRAVRETTPGVVPAYYAGTYYPGGQKQADAKPIEIQDDDIQGLDFRLHKTQAFLVRGKVVGVISGYPLEKCQIVLRAVDILRKGMGGLNGGFQWPLARLAKDGTFDFPGLHFAPGDYFMTATAGDPGRSTLLAQQRLTIRDRDIDDAVLNLHPLVELKGTVAIEGQQHTDFSALPGTPPPSVTMRVGLLPVDTPATTYRPSAIKADGSFTIADIAPGVYNLNMSGIPGGTWMKSVRIGSAEAGDGRVEITDATGTEPLEITLSRSVSQISGQVINEQGTPVPGGAVLVFSDPWGSRGSSMLTGVGENGRFAATNLRPGAYRIYAYEDLEQAQRYDLGILKAAEASSVRVSVKENEHAEVILRQIPAAPLR